MMLRAIATTLDMPWSGHAQDTPSEPELQHKQELRFPEEFHILVWCLYAYRADNRADNRADHLQHNACFNALNAFELSWTGLYLQHSSRDPASRAATMPGSTRKSWFYTIFWQICRVKKIQGLMKSELLFLFWEQDVAPTPISLVFRWKLTPSN